MLKVIILSVIFFSQLEARSSSAVEGLKEYLIPVCLPVCMSYTPTCKYGQAECCKEVSFNWKTLVGVQVK